MVIPTELTDLFFAECFDDLPPDLPVFPVRDNISVRLKEIALFFGRRNLPMTQTT